jgi:hypothetical protein
MEPSHPPFLVATKNNYDNCYCCVYSSQSTNIRIFNCCTHSSQSAQGPFSKSESLIRGLLRGPLMIADVATSPSSLLLFGFFQEGRNAFTNHVVLRVIQFYAESF